MGSINDYLHDSGGSREQSRRIRPYRRFLGQIAFSLILFLLVAAFISSDSLLGRSARYVAGEGTAPASGWIDFSGKDDGQAVAVEGSSVTAENISPADDGAPPEFTAPASGVVVTQVSVDAGGFTTAKGIQIQGNAGQSVKAAAAGTVLYLGGEQDSYIVQISHSGGFVSVYQGLSTLNVTAGDTVQAGTPIGTSATGSLTFSLILNQEEVDPLDYLFE